MMMVEKGGLNCEVDRGDIDHHAHKAHIVVSMGTAVVGNGKENTTEIDFHDEMSLVIIEVVAQAAEEMTADEESEMRQEETVIEEIA